MSIIWSNWTQILSRFTSWSHILLGIQSNRLDCSKSVYTLHPNILLSRPHYFRESTGILWAVRRDIFKHAVHKFGIIWHFIHWNPLHDTGHFIHSCIRRDVWFSLVRFDWIAGCNPRAYREWCTEPEYNLSLSQKAWWWKRTLYESSLPASVLLRSMCLVMVNYALISSLSLIDPNSTGTWEPRLLNWTFPRVGH